MSAHPRLFRHVLSRSELIFLTLTLILLPATSTVRASRTQWIGRPLAILQEDAALPAGWTADFPGLVAKRGGNFGFAGAVVAERDLPTLRSADLLLSRPAFLVAARDAAARQTLLDLLRSGQTLIALDTSTAELQRILGIEAETATPAEGYRPQLSAIRLLGEQWSMGTMLTPENAAEASPADLLRSALSAMTAWDNAPAALPVCEGFIDFGWLQFKHCPEYNYRERNTVCDLPRWSQSELAYRLWHIQQTTIGPDAFDGCEDGYYARQLVVQAQVPATGAAIGDWSPKNRLPASGVYAISLIPFEGKSLWSWDSDGVGMADRSNPADGAVAWSWFYPRGGWFQRPAAITGSFTSEPGWIERVRCDVPDYQFAREAEYTTVRGLFKKNTAQFAYTLPGHGEVCDSPAPSPTGG